MIIKPSHRIGQVQTYYFATKNAQIAAMKSMGKDVINLGIGSPDLHPPQEIIDTLQEASKGVLANKYQGYKGISELRDAFAEWYDRWFSVALDPNKNVLPLIGSKEGIMHISMAFLNEGDEVLVPNPGYPAYRMASKLAGATVRNFSLRADHQWKPDLDALRQQDLSKVKIMWINYPNMPTGQKADLQFFEEIIAFAREKEILICHDNPYGFILNDEPISIMQVKDASDVAIELNSLSKCFNMAGWRVGVMVGKSEYINAVMTFKSNMDSGMYQPIQLAAVKALSLDQAWFDELNEIYKKRREIVWQIMDLLACEYEKDSAGLFVWGLVPESVFNVEAWIEEILQKALVFITPGFIFGDNGDRYIRISLCSNIENLNRSVERITALLEKQKVVI